MDTPAAVQPDESTPTESADLAPKEEPPVQAPIPTTADQLAPVRTETTPPSKKAQTSPQPSAPAESLVAAAPAAPSKLAKIDYGWLATLMGKWIEDLDKRYPAMLRIEGIQGKVTLTAVLHEDGVLSDVRVAKSSGNTMLDQVAIEDVRKGSPIALSRPLERRHMPVKFSIIYDLQTVR